MARFLRAAAAMLLLPLAALADQAVTEPQTALPSYFANFQMALSLSPSDTMAVASPMYPVVPLTRGAGLNATQVAIALILVQGSLVKVDQTNYNLFNDSSKIAYVSCDPNESNISPSDVLNGLMDSPNHPTAILLYTLDSSMMYCSLAGNDLTYQSIWSMVSSEDAWQAKNLTVAAASSTVSAAITGNNTEDSSSTSANGGNSSAVAMSILYSITGLITLLFLIIIATGALRAHRNPERYGPRAGHGGRPRQSRARGLARAVLETLPIIKFGDPQPAKGDPDHELESVAGERRVDSPEPVANMSNSKAAVAPAPTATTTDTNTDGNEEGPAAQPATQRTNTPTATPHAEVSGAGGAAPEGVDENLGCAICTEDFQVGEDVRLLPCDHRYHPACIDPWLINVSGTCPLCRLDLRPQKSKTSTTQSAEATIPSSSTAGAETEATRSSSTAGAEVVRFHDEPAGSPPAEGRQLSRLSRITGFDWDALRHAPVDERVQALRQIREENISVDAQGGSASTQHTRLTDRLRDKFHIRTRRQA